MTISPAPAISGIEILTQLNYNPDDYASCLTAPTPRSARGQKTASIAPWWSPFPANQRESVKTRAHNPSRPIGIITWIRTPTTTRATKSGINWFPLDPARRLTPRLPIPLSKGHPAPMQRVTASMSAPTRAHSATNELMYEIFRARRALPAHVANSAPKPSCSFVDDREAIS